MPPPTKEELEEQARGPNRKGRRFNERSQERQAQRQFKAAENKRKKLEKKKKKALVKGIAQSHGERRESRYTKKNDTAAKAEDTAQKPPRA